MGSRDGGQRGCSCTMLVRAIALASLLTGCDGVRFQPGLASVASLNRPWTPEDFAHDVIANGDESCPKSRRAEDDKLFRRWPPCSGVRARGKLPPPPSLPPERSASAPPGPRRDPDILLERAR